MAKNIQEAFIEFNKTIKLDIEENKSLADKRDMLTKELNAYLKKLKDDKGLSLSFTSKNQGSYAMGTGIEPLLGEDYDIDVMILFDIKANEHKAKDIKKIVFDALDKYPRTTTIKKPCVTIQYHQDGETKFHVDLAVYAKDQNATYLSKKPKYATDDEVWEVADPEALSNIIKNYNDDTEVRGQFRRSIRYLKRWKDLKFNSSSQGKPTGIAITAIALEGFKTTVKKHHDPISNKTNYDIDDLEALINLVKYFINRFDWFNEISVSLPVKPSNDLFKLMSSAQKKELKEKLKLLRDDLISAQNETDPNKASLKLRLNRVLGEDFPEIPKEATGQGRSKAIITPPDQA